MADPHDSSPVIKSTPAFSWGLIPGFLVVAYIGGVSYYAAAAYDREKLAEAGQIQLDVQNAKGAAEKAWIEKEERQILLSAADKTLSTEISDVTITNSQIITGDGNTVSVNERSGRSKVSVASGGSSAVNISGSGSVSIINGIVFTSDDSGKITITFPNKRKCTVSPNGAAACSK